MKAIRIVSFVLLLVGGGLLVGAGVWYVNTRGFLREATVADGVVIDLIRSVSHDSVTYRPLVRFTDSRGMQIEFTPSVGSNPPAYARGERVEVLYLTRTPNKARIKAFFSLWGGPLVLGGIGAVFFLISAGITLVPVLQRRRDESLKLEGTQIQTRFQSVGLNTSLRVNGQHPYRITSQWQDPLTSEIHVFHSHNLWFDPTDYIKNNKITVYIARDNPKRYFMDVSFLPKLAD